MPSANQLHSKVGEPVVHKDFQVSEIDIVIPRQVGTATDEVNFIRLTGDAAIADAREMARVVKNLWAECPNLRCLRVSRRISAIVRGTKRSCPKEASRLQM